MSHLVLSWALYFVREGLRRFLPKECNSDQTSRAISTIPEVIRPPKHPAYFMDKSSVIHWGVGVSLRWPKAVLLVVVFKLSDSFRSRLEKADAGHAQRTVCLRTQEKESQAQGTRLEGFYRLWCFMYLVKISWKRAYFLNVFFLSLPKLPLEEQCHYISSPESCFQSLWTCPKDVLKNPIPKDSTCGRMVQRRTGTLYDVSERID